MDTISNYLSPDNEVIIIQKGLNKSERNDWNTTNGENVKDNLNIEYFYIRGAEK
jgi:hypothetical protein